MCLILFAYRCHPGYPLILAANRDEFFARPTEPLAFWDGEPAILAGRDLRAGGTWFGLTPDGRFAAVTNYRDPLTVLAAALSRGGIPVDFLQSGLSPLDFWHQRHDQWPLYNGFNLLAGDGHNLFWASNRSGQAHNLPPGLYGLSNHLLDSPWPKVERGKELLRQALAAEQEISPEPLFALLADRWQPPAELLPDTGIGPAWEQLLAPLFISGSDYGYGTRSSLVMLVRDDGRTLCSERTFQHEQGDVYETGRREAVLDFHGRTQSYQAKEAKIDLPR